MRMNVILGTTNVIQERDVWILKEVTDARLDQYVQILDMNSMMSQADVKVYE